MREAARAAGRLLNRATGEAVSYLRAGTSTAIETTAIIRRQPPEIVADSAAGYAELSGTISFPTSWFEDQGWEPSVGLDQVTFEWTDGTDVVALLRQKLAESASMRVFGFVLVQEG